MNKQKTLIGVGCSHTQGSAFIVGPETPDENGTYELASPQLKEKYKIDRVDEEFITNLMWIGKLNKYLKYDKVLNFGLGGRGIEPNIRSLRHYSYKVKDLSNHLIVIMIPDFSRKEILYRDVRVEYTGEFFTEEIEETICRYELDGNLLNGMDDKKFGYLKKNFFEDYYHEEYYTYKFLMDLYYLQDYLELKGAKVLMIPPNGGYPTFNHIKDYYKNVIQYSYNWCKFFTPEHSFNTELQTPPNIEEVIKKINWMLSNEISQFECKKIRDEKGVTLHDAGLVKGDKHLSELGSELVAMSLWEGLLFLQGELKDLNWDQPFSDRFKNIFEDAHLRGIRLIDE